MNFEFKMIILKSCDGKSSYMFPIPKRNSILTAKLSYAFTCSQTINECMDGSNGWIDIEASAAVEAEDVIFVI